MSISDVPSVDPSFGPDVLAAAEEATRRFHVSHPETDDRYGERGRAYATHDNAYLVARVQTAVDLEAPDTLRRNPRWLLAETDAARIVRPILGELAAPGGEP